MVKIGFTSNIKLRLQQIKSNCGGDAELILQYSPKFVDAPKLERRLHTVLSKHRHYGEWFDLPNIDIMSLCVDMDKT